MHMSGDIHLSGVHSAPSDSEDRYYLGFDAGTQSVKVAVYDSEMNPIVEVSNRTTLNYPGPRHVEMDPDEYVRLTVEGMAECSSRMEALGLDPHSIRSIMGDGIICGIVPIGADGGPIGPYINYLDSRTQDDADLINSWNLSIWGQETGNADASCMFPALFARWFLADMSDSSRSEVKFVHNAPYILMKLAGTEASDAFIDQGTMSGWGLGYDVCRKRWSDEQLSILGLDRRMMPRIVKPWDIIGHLTSEMSEKTGLRPGTPICGGAGDTMQSMLGCGLIGSGRAADVSGTCSMFCVSTDGIVPELSVHGKGLIFNSGTLDDTYFYWGFIRTGGLSLRWFRDNICGDSVSYDDLTATAAEVPPGSNGVQFLPYLTGGYGDASNASGAFLNLGLDSDRAVLWRAVLEAIGFEYIGVTDQYRSAGVSLDSITIAEGGSENDLWNQIKADMIGCTAEVMKTSGGAVLTDCITAAYAIGDCSDLRSALSSAVCSDRMFVPNADRTRAYRDIHLQRRAMMDDMGPVFSRLGSMRR